MNSTLNCTAFIVFARLGASLLAGPQAEAAGIKPISDFLSTQGTYRFDDGSGGCLLFVPPIDNFIGWSAPSDRATSIDYAGLADKRLKKHCYSGGQGLGMSSVEILMTTGPFPEVLHDSLVFPSLISHQTMDL